MLRSMLQSLRSYGRILHYMAKVFSNVLYGIWRLSHLDHAPVTIFGGARLKPDSIYMQQASELAHLLGKSNIPVLTGGGPGIMEAASCGAVTHTNEVIRTIGITVKGLDAQEARSKCAPEILVMPNYGARKWLLIHYSIGFAVFPGGFGTLDELMELLTLIQTKLRKKAPIVLIGTDYWKPFMRWVHDSALKEGLIAKEDVELFTVTDDIAKALHILRDACHQHKISYD